MCLNLVYTVINLVYMVINFYIVFINQTMSKSKHWNGITTDNPLGSAHFEDQSVAVLLRFETCGSTAGWNTSRDSCEWQCIYVTILQAGSWRHGAQITSNYQAKLWSKLAMGHSFCLTRAMVTSMFFSQRAADPALGQLVLVALCRPSPQHFWSHPGLQ